MRRAVSNRRDAFVAVAGAVAIALAVLGLAVVESRPSVEAALDPAGVAVKASGSHEGTPGTGTVLPGGACVPQPPDTQCMPPREEIQWRLEGLPPAPAGAAYAGFLRSGQSHEPVGVLEERDGALVLEHAAEDLGDATHVVLALGPVAEPGVVLHEAALASLNDDFVAALRGHGSARLDQIGAVSVSLLASGELEAPLVPGLVYRAWLEQDGRVQHLGELQFQGGRLVLDVRIERVHVPDQGRVLVFLDGPDRSGGPTGFPAFAAAIA